MFLFLFCLGCDVCCVMLLWVVGFFACCFVFDAGIGLRIISLAVNFLCLLVLVLFMVRRVWVWLAVGGSALSFCFDRLPFYSEGLDTF